MGGDIYDAGLIACGPITFGAVFARTLPATRGIFWDAIAVVNIPGKPFVMDPECAKGVIYYINPDTCFNVDLRTGVRRSLRESLK